MTIREKISSAINDAGGDADKAAIAICELLEEEIGLHGNGWFDDDPVMLEKIEG